MNRKITAIALVATLGTGIGIGVGACDSSSTPTHESSSSQSGQVPAMDAWYRLYGHQVEWVLNHNSTTDPDQVNGDDEELYNIPAPPIDPGDWNNVGYYYDEAVQAYQNGSYDLMTADAQAAQESLHTWVANIQAADPNFQN